MKTNIQFTHLSIILSILLVGCADDVPQVKDPHNVVVKGEKMTQQAFLESYCVKAMKNDTCEKVNQAMRSDFSKGAPPKGW